MKTYTLFFTAGGERISINVSAEVVGISTLKYKPMVDDKISEWLKTNKLTASSTRILHIKLCDELECNLFNQADSSDPNSIVFN